jgi:hypothetical protein
VGSKRAAEPTAGERIVETCWCRPGTDGTAAVFVVRCDGEGVKHYQKRRFVADSSRFDKTRGFHRTGGLP